MGWLSKIFKGSDHKISEGHYNANYREDTDYYLPSTSGVMQLLTSLYFPFGNFI